MTPREEHIEKMRRLDAAIKKTSSQSLKAQYAIALKRLSHELKIYDALRRGDKVGQRTEH